ncbi:unnamed protein product [Lampetra planeri]
MARPATLTVLLLLLVPLACARREKGKEGHQHHHHHHRTEDAHPGVDGGPTGLEKRLEQHENHFQGLECSYNHLEKYVVAVSDYMRNKFGQGAPQYIPLEKGSTCDEDGTVVQDCSKVRETHASAKSGVYRIQPQGAQSTFEVYCSFEADGAWTVFQHRFDGSVSFGTKWSDYKNGFGSLEGEHWLGLEKVYALTHQEGISYTLRIEVEDFEGEKRNANYATFSVDGEYDGYALHVGSYSGDAGDSFKGDREGEDQNGQKFSTMDSDSDACNPCIFGDIAVDSCSRERTQAGWWYSNCGAADLNGDWHPKGSHIGWASFVRWRMFSKVAPYSLKSSVMKIKPLIK